MTNICGVKLVDIISTKNLMQMLDLNKAIDGKRSVCVRWYGHILRKDKKNFMRRAID